MRVAVTRVEAWETCRSTQWHLAVGSLCDRSWMMVSLQTVATYDFPFQLCSDSRKVWRNTHYQTSKPCSGETQPHLYQAELKCQLPLRSHLAKEAAGSQAAVGGWTLLPYFEPLTLCAGNFQPAGSFTRHTRGKVITPLTHMLYCSLPPTFSVAQCPA